jgi:hypothetical protein
MPRDSAALDAALVAYLQADATLAGLQPDGVFLDDVRAGARRFVVVTLLEATDVDTFAGRAAEIVRYQVTAVSHTAVATAQSARAAGVRIDELLQGAALTVEGYPPGVTLARLTRIRLLQVYDEDRSMRYYIRGGNYELFAPN